MCSPITRGSMRSVSVTIELRSTTSGESICLRLKVRRCFVKLAARLDAAVMASTYPFVGRWQEKHPERN
jgi:hypothetical protein